MLTASVVLYKTPDNQITTLMKSILEATCVDKLFVIDNYANDKNKEYFNNFDFVEYIEHENTGYGASHNIAIKKAILCNSDYHVILNPDIEFQKGVLEEIVEYMSQNKDVVYVLPKVLYPDGEIQYLCKLLPTPSDLLLRRFLPKTSFTTKKDKHYTLQESGYDKIMNPPCLSGCFMFLRVETLSLYQIYFDERYFMYLEDFDLMRRLHRIGKTIYYPNVSIVHNHSKASYKNKKMLIIHMKSAIKYFNKFGWFFDSERRQMNKEILMEIKSINENK